MYLISIDINTGYVKDDLTNDSWKAIDCFKKLVERDGLKALTVVALSVDYLSIYFHYKESDRIIRVVQELYGDRSAINYNDELLLTCIKKYKELQFNPDLEQERIFNDRKISILEKINLATEEDDEIAMDKYSNQLHKHEESMSKFLKRFDKEKAIESSVTSSGYSLSRIENDLRTRKNSVFIDTKNSKNPNKLKLEDE